MTNLGTLPGFRQSAASDLNDSGIVVGGSVVWYNGVMVDLNTLIPAGSEVRVLFAHAINNAGQIVAQGHDAKGDVVAILLTPVDVPLGDLTCDGHVLRDDLMILFDQ